MKRRGYNKNNQRPNKVQSLAPVQEETELMAFLIQCFPEKSRTTVKSLLAHRQVLVNQKIETRFNFKLKPGDNVSLNKGKVIEVEEMTGIKILFEDENLIVIEKAAGLLSISTSGEKERTAYSMLSRYVKSTDPSKHVFVLHRLDRETSGVMMFSKSQEVQTTMQNNWREMVMQRTYTVIVEGKVEKPEGSISSRLIESKAMKVHTTQKKDEGQLAVTFFKIIKQLKDYAMLEVTLETGRKNQIRVHMEEMGNPVAGDKKYGAKTNPLQRLGLHASLLIFKHPITRETMKFESPLPKSFLRLMSGQDK
jgi:23S rRNA pseudouridine1911/1915/1917 synthase